ncbi:MAG: cyclopropane-fatty-acyl-phospholipid synthase family protein [Steroidobacteraceae bacterium]
MDTASDPEGLDADELAAEGRGQPARSLDARLMRRVLQALGNPPLEFQLDWTGERIAAPGGAPTARVRIADRTTLLGVLSDPKVNFGDAYSLGKVQVEGDLIDVVGVIYRSAARSRRGALARLMDQWRHRPRRNTLTGSRSNIHRHYDLGNEFYSLWLGRTMAYTCAYYPTSDATLDEAQVAKMDHVCRKLQLKAGDNVVEAGCGWGSLALHMASRYGARVRAYNISKEQIAFARERAREQGITGQVEFVEDDYRNISGRYDVFVSVGMLEHVGVENYEQLGRVARAAIGTAGRGLIHSIGRNYAAPLHPWIERRIFPGAYPPALSQMMRIFEPSGLSVLDVENIRLHYALTLRAWMALYDGAVDRVRKLFDEYFVRMWRLYLAGSIAAFETGTLQLFQVLFTAEENNRTPLTREFMYPR